MRALLVLLLSVLACAGSDYQEDYRKLKEKVPKDEMERHLAAWRAREPENPDAWILSANWFFEQAVSGVNITTKPPEGKDFALIDKEGKVAGSLSIAGAPSRQKANEAAAFLREALKRWPERFDIHCGLAHMMQETEQWEAQLGVLREAAAAVRQHGDQLRWCHAEAIPPPVDAFVAQKLHSYALRQYELETAEGVQRMETIAQLMIETAPRQPQGYNDLAIVRGVAKDWAAMQELLEKAAAIAPKDALVWMNLADNSLRLGRRTRAKEAYRQVLKTATNDEWKRDAKAALQKLHKR